MKTTTKTIFAILVMAMAVCAFAYADGGNDFVGTWQLYNSPVTLTLNEDGTWERSEAYNNGFSQSIRGSYTAADGVVTLETISSVTVMSDTQDFEPIEYGGILCKVGGYLRQAYKKTSAEDGIAGTWEMIRDTIYYNFPDPKDNKDISKAIVGKVVIEKETLSIEYNKKKTDKGKIKSETIGTNGFVNAPFINYYGTSAQKKSASGTWNINKDYADMLDFSLGGQRYNQGYTGEFITYQFGIGGYTKVEE